MNDKRIFISHSSDDGDHADDLAQTLRSRGLEPWLAKTDIALGSNFAEEITRAIRESNFFIVLLSKSSIASPHVKREVSLAVDKGIPLLPVIIGSSEDFFNTIPEEWIYWLTVVQAVQFENSTQTANEIVTYISSGKLLGSTVKPKKYINSRWTLVAAAFVLLITSSLIFIGQRNQTIEAYNSSGQSAITDETQETDSPSSQNPTTSKSNENSSKVLNQIATRLNKNGSANWGVEEKIEFPIGEIGRIESSDGECELSIFSDLRSANLASDDRNYTTNSYFGWLDKDKYSSNYIIMIATDGDSPCGRAASKAFGWPIKVNLGETYLEPGATPFEKCLIAQVREYGGTKQDAIGPCKFQFERDGKAIPELYLNMG